MLPERRIESLRNTFSTIAGSPVRDLADPQEATNYLEVALYHLKRLGIVDWVYYWTEESGPPQGYGDVSEFNELGFKLKGSDQLVRFRDLKGFERCPEIEDWNFENREDLELVNQGIIEITSGKVVIADPGYTLENAPLFNHKDFMRPLIEPSFVRLVMRSQGLHDNAVIQGKKAVYLGNFGGDGDYPIVRTSNGLEILLDYSHGSHEVFGKTHYIGSVWVDYKMIMLADASSVSQIDFPPDLSQAKVVDKDSYVLDSGKYKISFEDRGEAGEGLSPNAYHGRVVRIEKIETIQSGAPNP